MTHSRVPFRILAGLRLNRRIAGSVAVVATAWLAACSDSDPTGPQPVPGGDLVLLTTITDQSGTGGSSFLQTMALTQTHVDNADAFEQTYRPYVTVHGDDVFVLQGLYGDQAIRYVRDADGRLSEAGRMSLPPGGAAIGVVLASPTKGYLSLMYAGRILIFDPQTMTATGEIDLTTLDIARNPANPSDNNPEPGLMVLRGGKLYVGLQQLVTGFASADGTDLAVFDMATDTFEGVIHDPRFAGPGTPGFTQTMFVDEQGDLYVYAHGSYGFVPGQQSGILRVRSGQSEFDPDYSLSLEDVSVDVPGGRIGLLGGFAYGGDGTVYAGAAVPELASNPPDYANDRNFQAVRIHLQSGQIDVLPLPRSNAIGSALATYQGLVVFGLSTMTGVGLYTYDPATGEASDDPAVTTVGDPTHLVTF